MTQKESEEHVKDNITIIKYFNNEPTFNGLFSRENVPRIKDEAYMINLDDK